MIIEDKARRLLDRRLEALRSLSESMASIASARDELDARERKAWLMVTRAGWTEKDLRALSLIPPKRPRVVGRERVSVPTAQDAEPAESVQDGHPQ